MRCFRSLLLAGVASLALAGMASAQTRSAAERVTLTSLVAGSAVGGQVVGEPVSGATRIALRAGAMVSPRGAGLVGADFSVPGVSLGAGWSTRVDADVIFKANLGGVDTIIPVTVDQIYYAPTPTAGALNFYYGGGLGALFSGPAKFDGKLILGTEITRNIGGEVNVHFTENDTLVTLLVRLRP